MTDREQIDKILTWLKEPQNSRPVDGFAGLIDTLWPMLRDETADDPNDDRWKTLMNAATRIQQSVAEVRRIVADL